MRLDVGVRNSSRLDMRRKEIMTSLIARLEVSHEVWPQPDYYMVKIVGF